MSQPAQSHNKSATADHRLATWGQLTVKLSPIHHYCLRGWTCGQTVTHQAVWEQRFYLFGAVFLAPTFRFSCSGFGLHKLWHYHRPPPCYHRVCNHIHVLSGRCSVKAGSRDCCCLLFLTQNVNQTESLAFRVWMKWNSVMLHCLQFNYITIKILVKLESAWCHHHFTSFCNLSVCCSALCCPLECWREAEEKVSSLKSVSETTSHPPSRFQTGESVIVRQRVRLKLKDNRLVSVDIKLTSRMLWRKTQENTLYLDPAITDTHVNVN